MKKIDLLQQQINNLTNRVNLHCEILSEIEKTLGSINKTFKAIKERYG